MGSVPPVTVTSIDPLDCPWQFTLVCVCVNCKLLELAVMVVVFVEVHPFASVIITEYVPAGRFERSSVVAVFDHANAQGNVPPVGVKLTLPVGCVQSIFMEVTVLVNAVAGCVKKTVSEAVQPFASVALRI